MAKCQHNWLGSAGSIFDERRDDELMAVAGCDVKGSIPASVFTVDLSSYEHTNRKDSDMHKLQKNPQKTNIQINFNL